MASSPEDPRPGHPERADPRPFATATLVGLCTVVFVVLFVAAGFRAWAKTGDPGETAMVLLRSAWALDDLALMQDAGALTAARVWLDGEWWRVLTAGLLHGSWLHVVLNMMGLWVVGQWTERAWGHWRQALLFAVSSVGGCLASLAWAEAPMVVGASAGIFGMAGALVVARAWGRPALQQALEPVAAGKLARWLGFWLLLGFALPFLGVSLLAQAGHVGGLVFGSALGWVMSRRTEHRFSKGFGLAGIALGLLGLTWGAAAPAWRANYHLFLGSELLERDRFVDAAEHFDVALEEAPEDDVLANAVAYSLAEAGVELERAEELVVFALSVRPESADYLDTLGWVQCRRGLVDDGVATLERARELADREIPEIEEHVIGCAGAFHVERE